MTNFLSILQMSIGLDAHNRGKTHGTLIQGLKEVGKDHDDQDTAVDHFLESLVIFFAHYHPSAGVHLDLALYRHQFWAFNSLRMLSF